MIIGISGKIGSGKSHVTKYLKRKLKFMVIDSEKIMFDLITDSKLSSKLVQTFGPRILHRTGTIDRGKLKKISAQDEIRFKILRDDIDPLVGKEIKSIVSENEDNYIIESTYPHREDIADLFDVSVLVSTPKMVAYNRLLTKYPKKVVDNLLSFQKDTKKYDFLIENKTSIKDLRKDVDELVFEMFQKAA